MRFRGRGAKLCPDAGAVLSACGRLGGQVASVIFFGDNSASELRGVRDGGRITLCYS
jgi:hypothetical protein